jgi:UDP-N-acetylglucosamine 2-epimerase (non-hydrolysing)
MAMVIKAIQAQPQLQSIVCITAQHRQMLDQVLQLFSINADFDLNLMQPSQTLNGLASRVVKEIDPLLLSASPDVVLTHGDTTTAMATSLACFHRNIPVAHVEAGLRTYDLSRPFPEEMNRRVIDIVASYLFAPTERARRNLLSENLDSEKIYVTGNTVVDALQFIVAKINARDDLKAELAARLGFLSRDRKLILVTGHRRESFGSGFERICNALARISRRSDVEIVYPVHLNPRVSDPVNRIIGGLENVHLIAPTDYLTLVHLLSRASAVITDSGGIQEEAVSLGKRTLVMREVTERPEGVEAGLVDLVGTDPDLICRKLDEALRAGDEQQSLEVRHSIYGDGHASERIVAALSGVVAPGIAVELGVPRDLARRHAHA